MASNQKNVVISIVTKSNLAGVDNLVKGFNRLRSAGDKARSGLDRVAMSTEKLGRGFVSMNAVLDKVDAGLRRFRSTLHDVFGGVRMVGQALQNAGVMLSVFVTLPLRSFLQSSINLMLDFDEVLIEIRKAAGLTTDEMRKLGDALTQMSATVPQTVVELGKMAEMAARLGLRGTAALTAFTDVVAKLEVATDLEAEDAAKALARLTALFYRGAKSGEEYYRFLNAVGSALNEVGQATAATESQILSAVVRAAPAAAAIGMPVEQLIGLAGAVVETAASAERGGTQLNRALSELATNAVDVGKAVGLPVEQFRALIDENPTEVFLAVAEAIGNIESESLRAAAAAQLFGETGAKIVSIMAAAGTGVDRVAEKIRISESAFADATSLQIEFSRAMDGVKNQLKLLRNNINLLSISIGKVLLPQITKILTYAVPAVRELARRFEMLSEETKLAVVGFTLLATVLGPLMLAFGSTLFFLGMMASGFVALASAMFSIMTLPIRLAGVVGVLINVVGGLPVALVAAAAAILMFSDSARNLFFGFIRNMFVWGSNAATAFADGFSSAVQYAIGVVQQFLEAIARFFRAESPPKEGPLSEIDEWGRRTAEAFVEGFASASVDGIIRYAGIVSEAFERSLRQMPLEWGDAFGRLTSIVRTAASAVARLNRMKPDEAGKNVAKAIEGIGELVGAITGAGISVDSAWAKVSGAVGQFAEDIRTAIGLQSDLVSETKRLAEVRRELEEIDQRLQDEILEISQRRDLTLEERAALIRQAKIRAAARKRQLRDEEKAAEERVDVLRDELRKVEQIIETIAQMIQQATKAAVAKVEKPKVDDIIPIDGFEFSLGRLKDILAEPFEFATEEVGRFMQKVAEAEAKVKSFIAGLMKEDPLSAVLGISDEDAEKLREMLPAEDIEGILEGSGFSELFYEKGLELRRRIDGIVRSVMDFVDVIRDLKDLFSDGQWIELLERAMDAMSGGEDGGDTSVNISDIAKALGALFGALFLYKTLRSSIGMLISIWNVLKWLGGLGMFLGRVTGIGRFLGMLWTGVRAFGGFGVLFGMFVLRGVLSLLAGIGRLGLGALVWIGRLLYGGLAWIVSGIILFARSSVVFGLGVMNAVISVVSRIAGLGWRALLGTGGALLAIGRGVGSILAAFGIGGSLATAFGLLIFLAALAGWFKFQWPDLKDSIDEFRDGLTNLVDTIIGKSDETLESASESLAKAFGRLQGSIMKTIFFAGNPLAGVAAKFGTDLAIAVYEGLKEGDLKGKVKKAVEDAITGGEGDSPLNKARRAWYDLAIAMWEGFKEGDIGGKLKKWRDNLFGIGGGGVGGGGKGGFGGPDARKSGLLAAGSIFAGMKDWFSRRKQDIEDFGKSFSETVVGGFKNWLNERYEEFSAFIDAIVEWYRGDGESGLDEQGRIIAQAILAGIVALITGNYTAFGAILGALIDWYEESKSDIENRSKGIGVTIIGGITGKIWELRNAFAIIAASFSDWWTRFKEDPTNIILTAASDLGEAIVDWIKSGISSAWQGFITWLGQKIKDAISRIINDNIPKGDDGGDGGGGGGGGGGGFGGRSKRAVPPVGLGEKDGLIGALEPASIGSLLAPDVSKPDRARDGVVVNMVNNFYVDDDVDIEEAARKISRQILLAGA